MNIRILFFIFLSSTFLNNTSYISLFAADKNQTDINEMVVFTQSPRNLQFFARDFQDSAVVPFAGNVSSSGFDSIYLEVYRNNFLWNRKSLKLTYSSGNAPFSLSQKIHAELSEYYFKLYIKDNTGSTILIKNADSIVCGDVYIISGQSNSHNTNDTATYKNEFCRSFGVQTSNGNGDVYNPADTNWGISRAASWLGSHWTGPYNVGVWGLYLQKRIIDSIQIPTCIINGGRRGSTIEANLRNNSNQTDLSSVYGKLLYRVIKSGLAENIRAIFWYQGESNGDASWMNYESNFRTLYASWKENYPGFEKIFLFQVRQGCNGNLNGGLLREVQRQLIQKFPEIELISTMGIQGHGIDNCHYGFQGYIEISVNLYRQVAKNFYTISNITDISPPNIKAAYYTTAAKNEIALIFNNSSIASWPADTLNQRMKDYFYLNGAFGNVSTGIISGSLLKLQLINSSSAVKLTYLPSKYYNGTTVTYEGPFIRNSRRIGALSFVDFPITNYPPSVLNLTIAAEGYYNTDLNTLNIKDTLTVLLRNNFFPYQIRDSSKAVIDSVTLTGSFTFTNVPAGFYYIAAKSRNGIETWSSAGGTGINPNSSVDYDFTASPLKAFGNNMMLKGSRYCIYSGDVNQDRFIDLTDVTNVYNDANNFLTGYLKTDLTGDHIVDLTDLTITYNNSTNFVNSVLP
ncbi:MAG: hypothetical protein IPL53_06495 [Ignavibacteria bacterium]|nr:hypothetical protein [Ignavibacteria bacterium]